MNSPVHKYIGTILEVLTAAAIVLILLYVILH